jgi:hypothetical protein
MAVLGEKVVDLLAALNTHSSYPDSKRGRSVHPFLSVQPPEHGLSRAQ